MKPPANVEKYIKATYHNHEELLSEPPKPKRAIRADVPEIRRIIAEIKKKFPWYADSGSAGDANLMKIFSWLQDNDGQFDLPSVKVAVEVLLPELESDRNYVPSQPPPPPPTPPKPAPEKLESWQLPLTASKQQLHNADPKALKDYLARARAQKK